MSWNFQSNGRVEQLHLQIIIMVSYHRVFSLRSVLSDAKNLVELPSLDGSPAIEILRVDRASLSNIPESLCETSPRLKSL